LPEVGVFFLLYILLMFPLPLPRASLVLVAGSASLSQVPEPCSCHIISRYTYGFRPPFTALRPRKTPRLRITLDSGFVITASVYSASVTEWSVCISTIPSSCLLCISHCSWTEYCPTHNIVISTSVVKLRVLLRVTTRTTEHQYGRRMECGDTNAGHAFAVDRWCSRGIAEISRREYRAIECSLTC
jgi:hypothetical protein